jgi:hypothetical protein
MDGTKLGKEYLRLDRIAWSARAENKILAAFDKLEKIRAQVRALGPEAMADFDAVTMPEGFKSISKMVG